MKTKDIVKGVILSKEILTIFEGFSGSLDEYFKLEKNKKEHLELYNMYLNLNRDLQSLKEKYKL